VPSPRRRRVYHGAVNAVILIAGIAGLAVAGYGLFTLSLDASRRHQYVDIAVAVLVAVAVVALLILYGDRLLR
jgi:uncharacterized membrane protein SpoIIM required for sporulation